MPLYMTMFTYLRFLNGAVEEFMIQVERRMAYDRTVNLFANTAAFYCIVKGSKFV
jgi:hypothetical protein